MKLEDYFEIHSSNDIRLKGHRIGIETILFDYLDGLTPEEIVLRYPTVSLEEVYATITYYWRNQQDVDDYLKAADEHERLMLSEQELDPPAVVTRLRQLSQIIYLPLTA